MQRAMCELCEQDGGLLVARLPKLRVVRVADALYPAFYRVIWNEHVAEWTDLSPDGRSQIMQCVAKVETVLRQHLNPTKVNLASFGNMVPHLHWHVVARFDWDAHWPQPIWGEKQREVSEPASRLAVSLVELDKHLVQSLNPPAPCQG